ncbi:MAG: molybdopterin dinucleotide binding domain-containing protein, partial [Fusobacteriaceae bacterium]
RRGEITTKVVSTPGILEDLFFMTFHFAEGACNMLTGADHIDDKSGIPELKVTAVKLEKIVK